MKGVSFGAFSGYTTCGDHPMAQFYSLTFPVCNSLAGVVLNVVVQLERACFPRTRRASTTTKSAEITTKSAEITTKSAAHDNGGVPGVFVDD